VVSHLRGFPTFRVLASTRVPEYIHVCPNKAEVSKRQYSSKAKSCNIHYFVPPRGTVSILDSTSLRGTASAVSTRVVDRPGVHTHITRTKFSSSKLMYWRMFAYQPLRRKTGLQHKKMDEGKLS
jgi:hypothetical protein